MLGFLDLPSEVRLMIYDQVLAFKDQNRLHIIEIYQNKFGSWSQYRRCLPAQYAAITRTCSTVYVESIQTLYDRVLFRFTCQDPLDDTVPYGYKPHRQPRRFRISEDWQPMRVRRIEINVQDLQEENATIRAVKQVLKHVNWGRKLSHLSVHGEMEWECEESPDEWPGSGSEAVESTEPGPLCAADAGPVLTRRLQKVWSRVKIPVPATLWHETEDFTDDGCYGFVGVEAYANRPGNLNWTVERERYEKVMAALAEEAQ